MWRIENNTKALNTYYVSERSPKPFIAAEIQNKLKSKSPKKSFNAAEMCNVTDLGCEGWKWGRL